MCPQKWKASASPGLTRARTAPAPAASASIRDARARSPRRDVDVASPSAGAPPSGMYVRKLPFSRRDDALQLTVRVESALGTYGAVAVEHHRERAARDVQRAPHVRVLHLVEDLDRDERIAGERRDDRLQALTEPAGVGREDGERHSFRRGAVEALRQRDARTDRRPVFHDVE